MSIQFKLKEKYTLVHIIVKGGYFRQEIVITSRTLDNRFTYKIKGKRKEQFIPVEEELDKMLVFQGHNLPFVLNTERNRFLLSTKLIFISDNPDVLRNFVNENCLNPSPLKWANILVAKMDESDEKAMPLYEYECSLYGKNN